MVNKEMVLCMMQMDCRTSMEVLLEEESDLENKFE